MDKFKFTKNTVAYFEAEEEKMPSFTFRIEKAVPKDATDGKMIVEGVASSVNVDHDQERMAESALKRMANIINEKTVPLRIEHQKGDEAIVGKVFAASVDERGNLNIKTELNASDPRSAQIYNAMKSGTKLGFSVGGRVKNAIREIAEGLGKRVRTFYDVILDEVSLTPRPANFDAYAIAKSIADNEEEAQAFRFTPVYEQFMFENPQLDYLAAIEKSIPDRQWVKVEKQKDDIMNKLFGKNSSSSSEEVVDETKAVTEEAPVETTKGEPATTEYVDEKFKSIVDLLQGIRKDISAVDADASSLDSEQPVKEKGVLDSDVVSDQVSRQQGKETSALADEAHDQHNPEETKAIDEDGEVSTKAQKVGYRKTAETLLGLAKRLLKMEREGQEDTVGNGDLAQPRQRGEQVDPEVDTSAHDQDQPTATKSRRFGKTGLDVPTGTVEPDEKMDQHNPDETNPVETMKSNKKLAYELIKTARLLMKGTTTHETETSGGTTSDTNTNLEEFETAKEESATDSSGGRFELSDDEGSLVSTHDLPSSSEKSNSYGDEYDVTSKKSVSKGAPIDLLVAHISKTLDTLMEKSKQDHHRIIGLETQFMDSIYKNEDLQKSIKEMMLIPGPKKSVSMGTPYMFTKEGKRYPLVQVGKEMGAQEIRKSNGKPQDFRSFWKENKSTMYDNTPGLDG